MCRQLFAQNSGILQVAKVRGRAPMQDDAISTRKVGSSNDSFRGPCLRESLEDARKSQIDLVLARYVSDREEVKPTKNIMGRISWMHGG